MKKSILILLSLTFVQVLQAQISEVPPLKNQQAFAKIDFMSLAMPETTIPNEANMGFTGIHFNMMLNDWAYAGAGIYGSVSGRRGGFFTLGVNAGIKKYLGDAFYFDTGFHFGGGGGAAAPDGGGAFILPHANLGYDFKHFSINSGWSYVDFFDGGLIQGHQMNVGLEIPLAYKYTDYRNSESAYDIANLKNSAWNIPAKRMSISLHNNNLQIKGDASNPNVQRFGDATIRLAGFEFASYFTENWFGFLKLDGAFDGIKAGYMDVFLGGGYMFGFHNNRTNILAKFGVGAGGGGGVESQGGFLLYPDISIEQHLFNDLYVSVNKGYVLSPNGTFNTSSFGVAAKYYIERNGTMAQNKSVPRSRGVFKGIEVMAKQEIYFDAQRDRGFSQDMQQISLQANLDLTKNVFLVGETSFANFGNAGAYAEGIVGLGARTLPFFNDKLTAFTQVLAGAAGGGDISTGQGLIIKPSAGLSVRLNNTLSLRTAAGYVKASGGDLSSPFVNFGIQYQLSFLKLK